MGDFQLPGVKIVKVGSRRIPKAIQKSPPRTTQGPQGPRAMNGLTLGAPLFAGSGPWAAPAQWCGKERLESSTY